MNYQKIYDQLIEKRRKEPLTKSYNYLIEIHHIIPRSLNGSNDADNIINLTLREHYVAHLLLCKIADQLNDQIMKMKMVCAVYFMNSKSLHDSKLRITSRVFEMLKHNYTNGWLGRKHKTTTRNKIRNSMKHSNSTNPRVWMCKNGLVKYVLKTRIQEFLDNGFEFGRVGYKPNKHGYGIKLPNK